MNWEREKGKGDHGFWSMIFCLASALLPLLLCSKSSPLYPFNDWPDVNIFFTLGKGMMRGQVPYVDLIDHKGPYMYAAAGVGYLLSHDSFYGYFLFECLSMFFFLFYSWKILRLYTTGQVLWVLPLISGAVVSAESFVHGGSLEELSLGIFAYAIYSLLCFLRCEEKKPMPAGVLFCNGIWAGILLWSKFTLLGLYIAWMIMVLIVYLRRKQYRELWKSIGIFLGAMFLTTIPWLIYFGWKNALGEWLRVYIWNNIFGYTSGGEFSLLQKLFIAVGNALRSLKDRENWSYSLPVIFGCTVYLCFPPKRVSWGEKLSLAFMGLGMALGIFIGGTKHDYYGLPLAVFTVFGGLVPVLLVNRLLEWDKKEVRRKAAVILLCLAALAGGAFEGYRLSPNTYLLSVQREEMPQYRFAEQIKASGDSTLLNYGFLDGGFYTVLNQVPVVKTFCVTNLRPDVMLEQQNRYVEQQLTGWVVAWRAFPVTEEELMQLPVVSQYYELVDYEYFYFEGDTRTYALYRRRTFEAGEEKSEMKKVK